MKDKTLEELKEEATSLGLTYSANIGAAKLQEKIDKYYEDLDKEVNGEVAPVEVKKETPELIEELTPRQIIKQQEKENRVTKVIKVSMVDKRESSVATSVYYSTGSTGMRIPLDIWVEVPKILIELIEDAKALIHTEVNGKTVHKYQKKYVVEYK